MKQYTTDHEYRIISSVTRLSLSRGDFTGEKGPVVLVGFVDRYGKKAPLTAG